MGVGVKTHFFKLRRQDARGTFEWLAACGRILESSRVHRVTTDWSRVDCKHCRLRKVER